MTVERTTRPRVGGKLAFEPSTLRVKLLAAQGASFYDISEATGIAPTRLTKLRRQSLEIPRVKKPRSYSRELSAEMLSPDTNRERVEEIISQTANDQSLYQALMGYGAIVTMGRLLKYAGYTCQTHKMKAIFVEPLKKHIPVGELHVHGQCRVFLPTTLQVEGEHALWFKHPELDAYLKNPNMRDEYIRKISDAGCQVLP